MQARGLRGLLPAPVLTMRWTIADGARGGHRRGPGAHRCGGLLAEVLRIHINPCLLATAIDLAFARDRLSSNYFLHRKSQNCAKT